MTIDLEKIYRGEGAIPQEWAYSLYLQDRVQDGQLTEEDFLVFYGSRVTSYYAPQVLQAIEEGNVQEISHLLRKMDAARNGVIDKTFAPYQQKIDAILKKDGSKPQVEALTPQEREEVFNILGEGIDNLHKEEFPHDLTDDYVHFLPITELYAEQYELIDPMNAFEFLYTPFLNGWRSISEFLGYASPIPFRISTTADNVSQEEYADYVFGEFQEPQDITDLENEIGVEITLRGGSDLSEKEVDALVFSLREIKRLRPQDLAEISAVRIEDVNVREMKAGYADREHNRIYLFSPFSFSTTSRSRQFAQDNEQIFEVYAQPTSEEEQDYNHSVFHTVAHELGHLMDKDRKKDLYDDIFGKEDWVWFEKEVFFVDKSWELFAEDYATYLFTNGQEVARKTASGTEYPLYEERLAFMRDRFPLSKE